MKVHTYISALNVSYMSFGLLNTSLKNKIRYSYPLSAFRGVIDVGYYPRGGISPGPSCRHNEPRVAFSAPPRISVTATGKLLTQVK